MADFSLPWLDAYLKQRLGRDAEALTLEKFTRGTSRQTWFGAYRQSGKTVEITLRCDHPSGSSDPTPLDLEFFIYDRLGGAGLPVARALWWEGDLAITPRPFYIREKIQGNWNIPGYTDPSPAYDAIRIAAAKEHIATLAKIHALDWRQLGFAERLSAPENEAEAASNYVATVRASFDANPGEPMPIFYETCEWLTARPPAASRLSLCKGTNGLGEEVFDNGKLVALSDWEEVSIGDPASDFAFMQGFTEPLVRDGKELWSLQHALDYYEEVSGYRIALAAVQFYQVIRQLKMSILARNGATIAHLQPEIAFIRQVWTATEVLYVCNRVLASAMGLVPPFEVARLIELNQSVDML